MSARRRRSSCLDGALQLGELEQVDSWICFDVVLDCHDDLAMLGQEIAEDEPTPMPESHYTDLRRTPKVVGTAPIGARYVCTQCHAAQTDAVPLVDNTYKQ
jgi:nitrate reductase cytochrome c-type subunit